MVHRELVFRTDVQRAEPYQVTMEGELRGHSLVWCRSGISAIVLEVFDSDVRGLIVADRLSPDVLLAFVRQTAAALRHLHTKARVVHTDVKASNVLWRRADDRFVLADFSSAEKERERSLSQTMYATLNYRPPELFPGPARKVLLDLDSGNWHLYLLNVKRQLPRNRTIGQLWVALYVERFAVSCHELPEEVEAVSDQLQPLRDYVFPLTACRAGGIKRVVPKMYSEHEQNFSCTGFNNMHQVHNADVAPDNVSQDRPYCSRSRCVELRMLGVGSQRQVQLTVLRLG